MTVTLLIFLKICVVVLILAIGMGSTVADATYLWRRPALLARSLLAMYVLVPLAILALVKLLPLVVGVKAALLALAVSAGAPLLPRKLGTVHGSPYVFSLVVISSLLAILLVPAWVALLSRHFGAHVQLAPGTVAMALAKAFLLPLVIGMTFRAVRPKTADWLADRAIKMAGIGLIVCGALLLVNQWRILLHLGGRGMAALVCALFIALMIGHALGGPDPDDRTALAVACATRHIGIAVLVAGTFKGPRTLVLIAAYVIASAVVSIPYLRWRRALSKSGTHDSAV